MIEVLDIGIVDQYMVCCYRSRQWNSQSGYESNPGITHYALLYKACKIRVGFEDVDIDEMQYLVDSIDLYDCVGCHLKRR